MMKNRMIHLITGQVNVGKTTSIHHWMKQNPTLQFAGFLTPKINGERCFFVLPHGYYLNMEAKANETQTIDVGKYRFSKKSFDIVSEQTRLNSIYKESIIIIDEIGPLEARGEGFNELFKQVLQKQNHLLVVVRQTMLEDIIKQFQLSQHSISITEISEPDQNLNLRFD